MSKIIMTVFFVIILVPMGEKMLPTIQHWLCALGGGGCETCRRNPIHFVTPAPRIWP